MAALTNRAVVFARVNSWFSLGNPQRNISKLAKYLRRRKPDSLPKAGPKIYSVGERISSKGYLRPQREYIPPDNVDEQLKSVFSSIGVSSNPNCELSDPSVRFKLLDECFKSFEHGVPNSLLHTINKIDDVISFYKTPVDIRTPMERYQAMSLPPNLHIQFEYKRFDPENDDMFDGVSAFPKSGTIITGLKAKRKYKSTQPQNWTKDWRELGLGYISWR